MAGAVSKILDEMTELVPPGQTTLDFASREELHRLTGLLIEADLGAEAEYHRYRNIAERSVDLSALLPQLMSAYRGQRILVTGGTGCIGSTLVRQLVGFDPDSIFCIYHRHDDFDPVPGVVYVDVDICDEDSLRTIVARMRPDVIFHCAAQRSPWLAEREVVRTLQTNVVGTRNILRSARDVDAERFVHASTGKAMRYYTTDVYAASKKLAEWLVADYAAEGRAAGMARFTHVVDNAVVLQKVAEQLDRPDGVVRVHDPDIAFYAQSARESAQLLQVAGLSDGAPLEGVAIRALGEPARLLEVIVGNIRSGHHRDDAVIYLSGYDRGYERGNPPALYDPHNATELTPLVNAVEARTASVRPGAPGVDRFRVALPPDHGESDRVTAALDAVARSQDPLDTAAELAKAVGRLADLMFHNCPEDLFSRLHAMSNLAHSHLPTSRRPAAA